MSVYIYIYTYTYTYSNILDHCYTTIKEAYHSVPLAEKGLFFDLTDWTVFEAAATDLDELRETLTSYISFCEDMFIPIRTFLSFNYNKP